MKALRTTLVLACAGLMLGSTLSFAQSKEEDAAPGTEIGPNCDVTGYKTERIIYPAPVDIPDNVAAGVTLGPIFMPPDGDIVNDVILELNWAHTWVGDIIMDLSYDPDCSGPAAATTARVLCRPRGTSAQASVPCGTSTTTFGCSGDLVAANVYLFSDDALLPLGVGANCTVALAGGCFKQSDQGGGSFSIWRGLPKGGCWYLRVADNAGADIGAISGWAIYVRNQRPVAATDKSWGQVKNIYR
jgi:hypothetical protein